MFQPISKFRLAALCLTLALVGVAGPSFAANEKGPRCNDGIDNDLDGLIDSADPDCTGDNQLTDLENRVAELEALLDGVSRTVVTVNDYRTDTDGVLALPGTEIEVPTLVFSGMNVQIVNGLEDTETANGAGNLIVGYNVGRNENECPDGFACDRRWGSHMLVTGEKNNYTSFGGLLAGRYNETSGSYSSVSGGRDNTASGFMSSVSGGVDKTASSENCVVGDNGNDC